MLISSKHCIQYRNAGSVNESDLSPMSEIFLRDKFLHSINEMSVDLIQYVGGEFAEGLDPDDDLVLE